jgi:hypothetical protein
MILTALDEHIKDRLETMTFTPEDGPRRAMTIYPFIPDRDKGETKRPSIAFQRLGHEVIQHARRSCHSIFIPSEEEETIQLPWLMDKDEGLVTGPALYTRKPYPTPIKITYEIHTLAATKAHNDLLLNAMYTAIPPDYAPLIEGQSLLFRHDKPICLDDLKESDFRTAFVYEIMTVWVDRFEEWEQPVIHTIDIEMASL